MMITNTSEIDIHPIPNHTFAELMAAVLESGHHFRFQASGWSMHPFIRHGDILTIAPIQSDLSVGEVLCVKSQGHSFFIHRFVHSNGNHILLKGDNLDGEDGVFTSKDIIGKVVKIERNGKQHNFSIRVARYFVAFLSYHNLLIPLIQLARRIFRLFVKPGDHENNSI